MHKVLVLIALLFSFTVNAQITEEFENQDLSKVLSVLKNNYGLKLAYDPDLIKGKKVTANLKDKTIEEALKTILNNLGLSYDKVKKNYYTIRSSKVEWLIEGTLLDPLNEPIQFAKIRVLGSYQGAISEEDGSFRIKYKSDEPPLVEISSYGYKKRRVSASQLTRGAKVILPFAIQDIEEIKVEYLTEGILISKDVSKVSIVPDRIGAVPGSTEPDVFQIVQNVPGINSASSTVSEIQIRGGTADHNHLIWDGIPIYLPGHFYGMISSINPNIIHNANIHRGVYDPYYGGKASGLIELTSIDYLPKKIQAGAGVNLLQGDAFVITPIGKKSAFLLSGRRSYTDAWKSPTYQQYSNRVYQATEIENTGEFVEEVDSTGTPVSQFNVENDFFYYDLNGKLIHEIDSNNLLTMSGLYTQNGLNYSAEIIDDGETEKSLTNFVTRNAGASILYQHRWNSKVKSSLLASYASYAYNFQNRMEAEAEEVIELLEIDEQSNNVDHYSVKWDNLWSISENHQLRAGYQASFMEVNYSILAGDDFDSTFQTGNNQGLLNSLHANYTYDRERFIMKLGARATHLSSTENLFAEPRIYAQYQFAEWLTYKAGFALQNQFVSQVDPFDETPIGLSNRTWVMADDSIIPVVKSNVFNTGFVINHKGWRLDLDGYYKQINDIVNFSSIPGLSTGLLRGDARAMGIDFLIKKRWKNTRSWISYSLSDVKYYFDDWHSDVFAAPFNQPHTFKWVFVQEWRQFEFSTAFKIASGKPYTPIVDIVPNGNMDPDAEYADLFKFIYAPQNSKQLPVFHQLDMTIFYNFPKNPDKKWKGKVGVSCFNIYNQSNVLNRTFEIDVNEDGPTPELSVLTIDNLYLKITPNITARFQF